LTNPLTIEVIFRDSALSAIYGDSHFRNHYCEILETLSRARFNLVSSQKNELDSNFQQFLGNETAKTQMQLIFSGAFIIRPLDVVDIVKKSLRDSVAYISYDVNQDLIYPIRDRRFALQLPLTNQPSLMVLPKPQEGLSLPALLLSPEHKSYKTSIRDRTSNAKSRQVSTLVRFHEGASIDKLRTALYSIVAQRGCNLHIVLCVQNLSSKSRSHIKRIINEIPLRPNDRCDLLEFRSADYGDRKDLRSEMLHYGIQKAIESPSGYLAILDYDDVIFDFAYSYQIDQQVESDKPISLARVYAVTYEKTGLVVTQRIPNYFRGKSFRDFTKWNFIPTHSILIKKSELMDRNLIFKPGMKLLEDYFLLLQIIGPHNTNWQELRAKNNNFIGVYSLHSDGTLSDTSSSQRLETIQSEEYRFATAQIRELKRTIKSSRKTFRTP